MDLNLGRRTSGQASEALLLPTTGLGAREQHLLDVKLFSLRWAHEEQVVPAQERLL